MIQVVKPYQAPQVLQEQGQEATNANCTNYDASPNEYHTGKSQFTFSRPKIYNHPTVKEALQIAQHFKCCYCEKNIADEHGAVEHYRPKGNYKTADGTTYYPGYYWLAFQWSNLFLVCDKCNNAKGTKFPIVDEAKRATNHHKDIAHEAPLLINPSGPDNPRQHIGFRNERPVPLNDSLAGKTTIADCSLNRSTLNEKRKQLIDNLEIRVDVLYDAENRTPDIVDKAKTYLKKAMEPEAEFSAMAQDYIKQFL